MASNELLTPPTIKRRHRSNLFIPFLLIALTTSLALNAIFSGVILHARSIKGELALASGGWSKEAAEEAEKVAAIACSGHGAAFLDGAQAADGIGTMCECYGCFAGPDCSRLETDGCVADADRWALIKDEAVYEKMKEYVKTNILVLSHETQLRALKLLKVVLEKGNGREIFEFAHGKMTERWQILNQVLSKTRRFSLQHIPPQYCSFSHQVREASPAYAWLRCNREEDTDCNAILKSAGIIGRAGSIFGGEEGNRYVRLSLLKSQDDFELLIAQIEKLVSVSADEDGPKTM